MLTVLVTWVLAALSRLTVTPERPGSPASWMPLPFRSFQTKSPMAAGCSRPASMLLSVWPEITVTAPERPVLVLALLSWAVSVVAYWLVKV